MTGRGSLKKLGEATRQAISELRGRGESLGAMLDIRNRWTEIVGDALSRQLVPLGLREGTLDVGVFSSTWMNEARFFEKTILEKVRGATGLSIDALRLRLVNRRKILGSSGGETPERAVSRRPLDDGELARIDEAVRDCSDASLKERLRKLFRLASQRDLHRGDGEGTV